MSAPDTNIEKQTRRHKGPLVGMAIGLAVVGALFFAFTTFMWEPVADDAEAPVATVPAGD